MTDVHARLQADFDRVVETFHAVPACRRFVDGAISLQEYASLMTSIAWQARENPQIQAYATAFFRGHQREMVRVFFKHAISEIGHDQLAADDVAYLGFPTDDLFTTRPRPGAVALTAFAYYVIDHLSPVAYLGYLYFLEALPTRYGPIYAEAMNRIGVPEPARTFLYDHATIDVGHNRLMERYLTELIRTEADYALVQYAMQVTGSLYAAMVSEAFDLAPTLGLPAEPMPLEATARRAVAEHADHSIA